MDGGRVVETKQRQKRLFRCVPDYERPQLLAYMYLSRTEYATQNEDFEGERCEHEVAFDTLEWQAIMDDLHAIVDELHGEAAAPAAFD